MPWKVGYLLDNGALICFACERELGPGVLVGADLMYSTDPEIAIDNADCDRCGEKMVGDE
jgi:hypothetical protein